MKRLLFITLIVITLISISCENQTNEKSANIEFISVQPGGCNLRNLGADIKSTLMEEPDTLHFSLIGDTLHAFVGINYICCAPFITESEFNNDTIFISITDTCDLTEGNCYCRCRCYYTWEFEFKGFEPKTYNYLITLYNPVPEETLIFRKGSVYLN
ncbi:hypothetical protein ACE01N_06300 [Saccharicrinis sp. FJH2]|uniref:hypothetical protein n=1 Tax=Saccharicrinis sp. FJH65 TaxID=3344659 RepID=UPI0035F3C088